MSELPAIVAHCDWSKCVNKRWMAYAIRNGDLWELQNPNVVGPTHDLFQRLQNQTKAPGCLFIGFDFPIGLPEHYGKKTGLLNFRNALQKFGFDEWSDWYSVCERPDQISMTRPFYPMRPGHTKQRHLLDGLDCDVKDQLLRRCERKTDDRNAACMLFWTLGGNQVGKAAISGWRELLVPNLNKIGLWPFDGKLHELFTRYDVVVAETYPGDAYRQIGIPRSLKWSKRKCSGRKKVSRYLLDWLRTRPVTFQSEIENDVACGFSENQQGEDIFDAMVGLFSMLDVTWHKLCEEVPDYPSITDWEGWILGQKFNHFSGNRKQDGCQ